MKYFSLLFTLPAFLLSCGGTGTGNTFSETGATFSSVVAGAFTLPDTGQSGCYDNDGNQIACALSGVLAGQDGAYSGAIMAFQSNGDGTVTDLNTGLTWTSDPGEKKSYDEFIATAAPLRTGGYTDWRAPSIKELYSLINFNGVTGTSASNASPYIDTAYFSFTYGDASKGERYIDSQYWSATEYVSTTMNGDATIFGVNFADGRIKGYPRNGAGGSSHYAIYLRGPSDYGENIYTDNGDETVTDGFSGLIWQKGDDALTRNWEEALSYCENLTLANSNNWRLPNAKELQSIVDYTRSPDTTGSPAIDPVFSATPFVDGNGLTDYGYYWSSTTHLDGANPGDKAVYVAFGEALGYMTSTAGNPGLSGGYRLLDVHGAGAQRSDPKRGNPADYPTGHGPQGDVIAIYNYARCVRG